MADKKNITLPHGPDKQARWVSMIHRLKMKYLDRELADIHLGGSTFTYLVILSFHPWLRQEVFCRELCLDKGSVARTVARLEGLGYVKRDPDPEDGRAYRVAITQAGKATLPRIDRALKSLNTILLENVTEKQQRLANKLFRTMSENLAYHLDMYQTNS